MMKVMTKWMSMAVFAAILITGVSLITGQAFAGLAEGKDLLINHKDVVSAHEQFTQALAANPTGQVENFWHALTLISANTDLKAKLRDLKVFDINNDPMIFDAESELNYSPETLVDNIILDDGAEGYTDLGGWVTIGSPDPSHPYDTDCRYHAAGTGTNTAKWTPTITWPGYYSVYAWIAGAPTNASNAEYTVTHANGSSVTNISQNGSGGYWVRLGEYRFSAGTGNSVVLSDKASGRVIADAMKFVYAGVIKDDTDAVFTPTSGEWQTVTGGGNAFNGSYRLHAAGTGAKATWTLDIPNTNNRYLVFAKLISTSDAAKELTFDINPAGGVTRTVTIDWGGGSEEWYCLGLAQFTQSSGNTVVLYSSADGKVTADAVKIVPAKPYPTLTEGQNMFQNNSDPSKSILVQIDAALQDLSFIDDVNKSFYDVLDNADYPELMSDVYVDYGDAKVLETALYAVRANIKISAAYEMDNADVQWGISNPEALLDMFVNLGKLRSGVDTGALLTEAKTSIVNSIDSYMAASEFFRSRTDGFHHIIELYDPTDPKISQEDKDEAIKGEGDVRSVLVDLRANLTDHSNTPHFSIPEMQDFGMGAALDVDAFEFFSSGKVIRTYVDEFGSGGLVHDNNTNVTLEGILPNMTAADWNRIFNNGPVLNYKPQVIWNNGVPSVVLQWDASNDLNKGKIVQYRIYRALSPGMESATLLDTINDPAAITYTDASVGSDEPVYYYRLDTFYNFGGGDTARTYSEASKAVIRMYVYANSVSQDEDGSKTSPHKDLSNAIYNAIGGTKICVAKGTYYESSNTLWFWGKNGIILEGGYDPVTWRRDVVTNVTTIDASQSGQSWGVISLWQTTGITIDGFSVTGLNQQWQCAIQIGDSSNLTIRNCRVYNNNLTTNMHGIGINQNCSNILIEGCRIDHNSGYGITVSGQNISATIFNSLIESNNSTGINCGWDASASVVIKNNTIVKNKGNGGIYYSGVGSMTIRDNIIANNTGYGVYRGSGATPTLTYNDVYGNSSGAYTGCTAGTGSKTVDPLFVNSATGDYHLQTSSPCVEFGSATAVSLGLQNATTRSDGIVDSGTVDMGYHYLLADKYDIIIDFGSTYGIWVKYDNLIWNQIHNVSPESIITGDLDGNGKDDIIVNFGSSYGIWIRRDTGAWTQIHTASPKTMVTGDIDGNGKDDIVMDFGVGEGIWIYRDTGAWTKLHSVSPKSVVIGDLDGNGKDDIVIDFGAGYGIWIYYNDSTWQRLHEVSADSIAVGDLDGNGKNDIAIDFGDAYGIWVYSNNSIWAQLHTVSPKSMVIGDIDGGGKDDIAIDFGATYGIWIKYNGTTWQQLHNVSSKSIALADINGSGKKDLIVDFGSTYGIWVSYDGSSWSQLHTVSADSITTGELND